MNPIAAGRGQGRGRHILVLVAALLAALLTARLGVWQLDRARQKTALQQAMEARAAMAPLSTADLARDEQGTTDQLYRDIVVEGRWLTGHTVYLDNRPMDGRAGFYVLSPLQLADGSAVVVQRGWVPRDVHDRSAVPDVPTPAGHVAVKARIAPPPTRLYDFGGADEGRIRQNLDLASYGREIGVTLRPLSLQQRPTLDAVGDGLKRDWPLPAVDVHKHHGYAFQWFALCALITGLYVWFQLVQPHRRRRRA